MSEQKFPKSEASMGETRRVCGFCGGDLHGSVHLHVCSAEDLRQRVRDLVASFSRQADTIKMLQADRDRLQERCVTIADEAFGPNPVQSADDALTQIERGMFEMRKRLSEVEAERDRYKAALELYADEDNYPNVMLTEDSEITDPYDGATVIDRGQRARAALKGGE